MAPSTAHGGPEHDWTPFELHTLRCLMCKGMHLGDHQKCIDNPTSARKHAYLNVATELNKAINKGDFAGDIDRRVVARKIDEILKDMKGVVALMERQGVNRITRNMKLVWDRKPAIGFLGTKAEWEGGRRDRERERKLARRALGTDAGDICGPIRPSIELGGNRDGFVPHNQGFHFYSKARTEAPAAAPRAPAQLNYSDTCGGNTSCSVQPAASYGDVDKFFDEWEKEKGNNPSISSINHNFTSLASNVVSADRRAILESDAFMEGGEINEGSGLQMRARKQVPKGGNSVPLPFNRLEEIVEMRSDVET